MDGYWMDDEFVVISATPEEIGEIMSLPIPDISPVTDPIRWSL